MKQLVIVRHAKSSWDDMSLDDHDRPLNKRGHRNGPDMGNRMKERNIIPDLMITSSARRAMDTCSYLAGALGYSESDIIVDPALYHSSTSEIFKVIRAVDDSVNTLYIFGHNPGFTSFANTLNNTNIYNIPTAGIVVSEISANTWSAVAPGSGTELLFDYPKKPRG